ncbi:hypothetical protein NASALF_126 [Candidatus Nasuia deltocephalinicola str. NAS-ALF]|uniref:Uncharacterized protein n=1 Tax=Candidatus Nasuia deltocephalinicola str. NAS-ALF TaxID=1343077 RepID=S5SQJ8_9PROT|nr:hypothetical protein NASALF_126 [Candidatus Nasuia deltocephalinicola str. NAS-ALF]
MNSFNKKKYFKKKLIRLKIKNYLNFIKKIKNYNFIFFKLLFKNIQNFGKKIFNCNKLNKIKSKLNFYFKKKLYI